MILHDLLDLCCCFFEVDLWNGHDLFALRLLDICICSQMLWDWLADAALLCTAFLLVLYYVSPRASPCLGRSPLVALPAVGFAPSCLLLALLFCLLLALLSSVLFILSPCSTMSAALRCSSRCPRTRVALLRLALATSSLAVVLYRILTTGSLALVLSLILSRDTLW